MWICDLVPVRGYIYVAASSADSFADSSKAQVNDSNFQLHLRSCGLHVDDLGKVMDPLVLKKKWPKPGYPHRIHGTDIFSDMFMV